MILSISMVRPAQMILSFLLAHSGFVTLSNKVIHSWVFDAIVNYGSLSYCDTIALNGSLDVEETICFNDSLYCIDPIKHLGSFQSLDTISSTDSLKALGTYQGA